MLLCGGEHVAGLRLPSTLFVMPSRSVSHLVRLLARCARGKAPAHRNPGSLAPPDRGRVVTDGRRRSHEHLPRPASAFGRGVPTGAAVDVDGPSRVLRIEPRPASGVHRGGGAPHDAVDAFQKLILDLGERGDGPGVGHLGAYGPWLVRRRSRKKSKRTRKTARVGTAKIIPARPASSPPAITASSTIMGCTWSAWPCMRGVR